MKQSIHYLGQQCLLILCLLTPPLVAQAAAGKYVCENGKEVWKSNAELEAMNKPDKKPRTSFSSFILPNPCTFRRGAPQSSLRMPSPEQRAKWISQDIPPEVLNLQLVPPPGASLK